MDNKKIGFFNEGKYCVDSNGMVYSSDIFTVFIKKIFHDNCIKTIGRFSANEFFPKYELDDSSNFTPLSYYKSITILLLILPIYFLVNRSKINDFIGEIDTLYISASGPLSLLLLRKMRKKNKKVFIFIRQNTRGLITVKHNSNFLAKSISNYIETSIENYVKNYTGVTVFAFGDEILQRYSKLNKSTYSIADSRYNSRDILSESCLREKNHSKLKLLYVGRLAPGKGLEFLIKSLSKINKYEYSLTIIGDGIVKNDLLELTKIYGLSDKIIFKGHMNFSDGLLNEYSSHDVLILPSFSEGLPQVIFEAMARGAIVVATKVGGIPGQIEDRVNGFLFNAGDESQLLGILDKIVLKQLNLIQIRKNALLVAAKYSFENQKRIIKKIE